MPDSELTVCLLYPDLLGTYGDRGNATVVARRAHWRGLAARVLVVEGDDPVPGSCDLYIVGGGEDLAQRQALERLRAGGLVDAVDRGAALLAICAGYQLIGERYEVDAGRAQPGLGLVDAETVRGPGPRLVGEVTVRTDLDGVGTLQGYENHAGVTRLRSGDPFGRRVGPGGEDLGPEGTLRGKVVGTYLHGPVLARNPALADWFLGQVVGGALPAMDEEGLAAEAAHRMATHGDRLPVASGDSRRWFGPLGRFRLSLSGR